MRVAIDARCLNTPHLRGMGKALLAALESAAWSDIELVLMADEPRHPMARPEAGRVETRVWEVPGHRFRAWEQFGLPWTARRLGCDVLHATGTWAPWWQPVPTVVTIHDTIPWEDDENDENVSRWFLHTVQPRAYAKASVVLTPSANSRNDIVRRWPALAAKVDVVPWGISPAYTGDTIPPLAQTVAEMGVREPYLLYFGGHVERKRLAWAIDVWQRATPHDVQLVICGLIPEMIPEWRAKVPDDRSRTFLPLGFVDESLLPGLYGHALGILYPTMYEGFGFPALEAQAVGRPVLVSAVGSLQELAGPGAVVLPPHDLDAWVHACQRLVSMPLDVNLESKRWARTYSWAAVADKLLGAYRAACGQAT